MSALSNLSIDQLKTISNYVLERHRNLQQEIHGLEKGLAQKELELETLAQEYDRICYKIECLEEENPCN